MATTNPAFQPELRLKKIAPAVTPDDLVQLAKDADEMLSLVRESMLRPHPRKNPPVFSTTQLGALCGIDKSRVNYLVGKGELPAGELQGSGRARSFTLAETIQWVQAESKIPPRPASVRGRVIVIVNFKGGSGKTTTTFSLAQGLTLRGRKVLAIDLDPQASLTTLCGLLPDAEIAEENTVMPFIYGDEPDLRYAIRDTYWHNLDLIPGAPSLFAAEFEVPHKVAETPAFPFWDILNKGISQLTGDYDVILIDTPPSLSYLTINAIFAGDGLIMPLPPHALDFASAAQFWSLFSDLTSSISKRSVQKTFDFVDILLNKVNTNDASSDIVRDWIRQTYAEKVMTQEIPLTTVAAQTATEFGTVYDVSRWEGSAKTYARARDAYDNFVSLVDQKLVTTWYQGEPAAPTEKTEEASA